MNKNYTSTIIKYLFIYLAFWGGVSTAFANEINELRPTLVNEWVLIKNDKRRQIKTYAKLEDAQRIRSFKVEGILKAKPETLVRVLLDFANYSDWYWEVCSGLIETDISIGG